MSEKEIKELLDSLYYQDDFCSISYDKLKDYINNLQKENERLQNIIKEVREYIEENQEEHRFTDRGGFTYTEGHFLRDSDTLLEILDKGE